MKKIEAIIRPEKLNEVKSALDDLGFHGMNFIQVTGRGAQRGIVHQGRGGEAVTVDLLPKLKLEVVVADIAVERVIEAIIQAARTGNIGDGKIFVCPIDEAIRVRTGERGDVAV
ncbi:MAG TPA: P-II family nitrogen regulator [Caulobacteraceae bacterium]|nr:P-II family nitrogen regulator [Caulobacteraceae bacterium]